MNASKVREGKHDTDQVTTTFSYLYLRNASVNDLLHVVEGRLSAPAVIEIVEETVPPFSLKMV